MAAVVLLAVCCGVSAAEPVASPPVERPITSEERDHWAYKPLANPSAPEITSDNITQPIDRFLHAARAQRSISSLPRAGKAALLRRVSFDLTGLPPSAQEVRAFLKDGSADAYEKLVDRLLASPAYGERWAQHWLDLARFAETDGFEHDLVRANAWRYRDWVIDALNADMPFDEFLSLQLAGDELRPDDPDAAVATGFLLCGPDMPDLNLQEERRHVVLNEMTSTVGSVFLGLQFGCAQCHDHKFDPIRQHDFYRLRAFFEPANIFGDSPIPSPAELASRRAAEEAADPLDRQRRQRQSELEELGHQRLRDKNPDLQPTLKQVLAELSKDERKEHERLSKELRDAPPLPELPLGRVVRDGEPRAGHLYIRGDFRQKGPEVSPGFPLVLLPPSPLMGEGRGEGGAVQVDGPSSGGPPHPARQASHPLPPGERDEDKPRGRLAAWLSSADNPLVARVIVNRLWQWHFGEGLAPAASDFGVMGGEPANPELLDWLARRFIADRWSFKKFHRLLVTSEAYQAASGPFDGQWSAEVRNTAVRAWNAAQTADPDNKLLWRRRRTRLDGESIRDAMLAACERLSSRRGGPGIRPPLSREVTDTLLVDQWKVNGDDEDHRRRSIYLFVRRNLRYPMFDVFDRPDTNASCPARHESTTATQSLVLFNSQFSLQCARWLAGALLRGQSDSAARRIEEAYLRVLSRPATADEICLGQEFLARQTAALRDEGRVVNNLALPEGIDKLDDPLAAAALVDFCLALFNFNEFVYLD